MSATFCGTIHAPIVCQSHDIAGDHDGRPRHYPTVRLGPEIGRWYASNGAQSTKPEELQLLKALEMFRASAGQPDAERTKTAPEIWKILSEVTYSIGTVGLSPAIMGLRVVKNNIGNVPSRQMYAQHARTPCSSHPTTLFFKS